MSAAPLPEVRATPAPAGLPFLAIDLPQECDVVELYVFSDMHIGDPRFDRRLFAEIRDWILAAPNRFAALNGDILNAAIPGAPGGPYDDIAPPRDQLRWAKREFEPLRDRILAVTDGNHEHRITRTTSLRPMEELCDHLGLRHRHFPDGVLIKVRHGRKANHKPTAHAIYITHGASGAALEGGKALSMARMSDVVLADVYIQSHTHWRAAFKLSIWIPDLHNNTNRLVERLYVNSSTLLQWGGYAQAKGYKPPAQGAPHIRLYCEPKRAEAVV